MGKPRKSKALYFPREPEFTVAAKVKKLSRRRLIKILGNAYDLLKTEPREHQLAATVIGIDNESWLFALDMGLGKTAIAIYVYTIRRYMGEVNQCLVTCPPIVLAHWAKEVKKHSDHSVELVEGSPAKKLKILANSKADFVVVSHNWITRLFSQALSKKSAKFHPEQIQQICDRYDMLVIDEAHGLKNPESTGFATYDQFLAETPYLYELTGTPTGNDYTGVWALYYLLDFGKTYGQSFKTFIKKWFYTIIVGKGFPIYRLKKRNKEDFFDRFWSKAVRWEEAECNDLPEKEYILLEVEMTKAQQELYDQFLAMDPDNPDEEEGTFWDLMRVTGGVDAVMEDQGQPSAKINALNYIIDEVVLEQSDQLIVWHWLNSEGVMLADYIRSKYKLSVGEIRGNVTQANKNKALDGWRAGKVDVLVANPASLGIGVDLYEARVAVYYSNSFSMIHRRQSEKRTHRDGQTRRCLYFDIVCVNTIDDYVLGKVQEKVDAFAGLTRDKAWQQLRNQRRINK